MRLGYALRRHYSPGMSCISLHPRRELCTAGVSIVQRPSIVGRATISTQAHITGNEVTVDGWDLQVVEVQQWGGYSSRYDKKG